MSKNNIADSPIFIYGHGKSGTTLMLSLLDNHEQIITYPVEPYFWGRFVRKCYDSSKRDRLEALIELLRTHYDSYPERFSNSDFDEHIQSIESYLDKKSQYPKDYVSATVLALAEVTGRLDHSKKYWVEKTPEYEKYGVYMYEQWPNARFIHLIRDPRDNFCSYKRSRDRYWPHKKPVRITWFVRRWLMSVRLANNNQSVIGGDQYLIMRYEDLVQYPTREMDRVADFLGIRKCHSLLAPTINGVCWSGNSTYDKEHQGISSASVGKWREHLSDRETKLIESYSRHEIKKLDYHFSSGSSLLQYNMMIAPNILLDRMVSILRFQKNMLLSSENNPVEYSLVKANQYRCL